jgi:hypothetical protein
MAIQFVGGKTVAKAATANATASIDLTTGLTGGSRSGVAAGDLVIIVSASSCIALMTMTIKDSSAVSYNLLTGNQGLGLMYVNDTTDACVLVGYKIMGTTPDSTATFTQSLGSGDGGFALVYVFSGVHGTTPMDVATTSTFITGTGNVDPTAITPVTSGAVVVSLGAVGHVLGAVNHSIPDLTSTLVNSVNSTRDCSAGIGYITWTSGALDPAAWTLTGSSTAMGYVAMSMALRPAPGGGNIKVWNGSAWTAKPVKFWNGSAWITKPMKRWNGSAWITLPY